MNDMSLPTGLDDYLERFATFAAPPRRLGIPEKRGRGLNVLAAVAVVAVIVAILVIPIVLGRLASRHPTPAVPRPTAQVPPQPPAKVSPQPPLRHNGQIVFGEGNRLMAIDPNTGHLQLLFSGPGDVVSSPAYAPDGTKLAYLQGPTDLGASNGTINGYNPIDSIWVLDTTTGRSRQLTTCQGCGVWDHDISWSPDSSRVAFSQADQHGSLQLYLIDADGTHLTQLTHLPAAQNAAQPTWSPDGARIAFVYYTVGNNPIQGQVVATVNIDDIRPDGTGLGVLVATSSDVPVLEPAWSPNGSKIAYLLDPPQPGGGGENQYQVWLMNPDGSHRTEIFRHDGCCVGAGFYAGPAWSPDGTRIAADVGSTLWVMSADGGEPTSLGQTIGDHPAWQPVP